MPSSSHSLFTLLFVLKFIHLSKHPSTPSSMHLSHSSPRLSIYPSHPYRYPSKHPAHVQPSIPLISTTSIYSSIPLIFPSIPLIFPSIQPNIHPIHPSNSSSHPSHSSSHPFILPIHLPIHPTHISILHYSFITLQPIYIYPSTNSPNFVSLPITLPKCLSSFHPFIVRILKSTPAQKLLRG